MAEYGVLGADLKKMIKAAKSAPVSFGFNPGKSDDEAYLGMHRTKAPQVLGKDAKETGEGGKFAFGTATVAVSEKEFRLTCERVLPGLAKRMKKFLKAQKISLNVVILDADGNLLESDIEDDLPDDPELADSDETAPEDKPDDTPPATGDRSTVLKRLEALRGQIVGLAPELQAKVAGPFKQLIELVKAGDVERAALGAERLEKALKTLAVQAPPPNDPRLAQLTQILADLRLRGETLSDPRIKAGVLNALNIAAGHIEKKDVEACIALLKKVQELFKAQEATVSPAAPTAEPSGTAPQPEPKDATNTAETKGSGVGGVNLVKLGIARNEWPTIRQAAHDGIRTLQAGIQAAYAPYPSEAGRVQAAIGVIGAVVSKLDDTLKKQLDDVYNAQDEASRASTIDVVRRTVEQFHNYVTTDPVASSIDDNSFVPNLSAIAPVRANLDQMMAALGR